MERETLEGLLAQDEEATLSPHIEALSRIAALSAKAWRINEANNLARINTGTRKAWPIYNSPISYYEADYEGLPHATITETLEEVRQRDGQVVCVVFGTDDNPLQGYIDEVRKTEGDTNIPPVVVITVSLDDRRDNGSFVKDGLNGRFAISGSVGSDDTFQELRRLMDRLTEEGIIKSPYAQVAITRLIGGWNTLPFNDDTLLTNIQKIKETIPRGNFEAITDEEKVEADFLLTQVMSLDPETRQKLYKEYILHIIHNFQGIMDSNNFCFFGESMNASKYLRDNGIVAPEGHTEVQLPTMTVILGAPGYNFIAHSTQKSQFI